MPTARQVFTALAFAGVGVLSARAAHAGPEVTLYLTLPLGTSATSHVFGLRLDRSTAPPDVRVINPESPLNRRPLLDLQMGANSALRLELDRRLTWDIDHQELRQSSRPASFTLRLPVHNALHEALGPLHEGGSKAADAAGAQTLLAAALANPLQNEFGKPLMKASAIEP
jgi:hypothetical protein